LRPPLSLSSVEIVAILSSAFRQSSLNFSKFARQNLNARNRSG
jgi:hypothetical protein